MIREKLALKEQVDSLEQNLSKQIKEKECLFQTFTVFKNESKEKEDKYMENEIDLEKKIKELDNIIFKVGQSAQTVHMLTKPQAFYDNIHKQALGYQNPFHLKKPQRIKPTLYDGIVMSTKHVAMHVIDDEETLILEERSRSKMSEKAKDPEIIDKKISHKPIDYEKINRPTDNFGKRFTPQQEMDAEQAFWFHILNPSIEYSNLPPVKVEVPSELPKVSLVNASLKKLKFHLAQFDYVVKKRATPDARTKGEWGFEHTKAVFNNEIIPFLKSLKDIFNVFNRDLLNEIMEVQTVFDQMDARVSPEPKSLIVQDSFKQRQTGSWVFHIRAACFTVTIGCSSLVIVVDGSYWSRTITTGTGLDSTGLYNASSFDHGYVGRICSSFLRRFRDSSSATKRNGGGSTCVCDSPAMVQGQNNNDFVTDGVSLNAMGGRKTAVATVL
ncbi:hypothetical protein Tco_0047748 [Tanacetum coccineum]